MPEHVIPSEAGAPPTGRRLYHGTVAEGVAAFEPRRRYTPGALGAAAPPAVYATDDPAYAAAHAFPWSSAEGFDLSYRVPFDAGGRPVLRVPAGQAHRLERPVFVYALPAEAFEPLPTVEPRGRNYRSRAPVRPVGVERFPTVRAAVEHYGGRVELVPDGDATADG